DLHVSEPTTVQFLSLSRGTMRLRLNGEPIHQSDEPRTGSPEADRFEGTLRPGANRLIVRIDSTDIGEFSLRLRRESSSAEHELLMQSALSRSWNVERGRKLFFDSEKSKCVKC